MKPALAGWKAGSTLRQITIRAACQAKWGGSDSFEKDDTAAIKLQIAQTILDKGIDASLPFTGSQLSKLSALREYLYRGRLSSKTEKPIKSLLSEDPWLEVFTPKPGSNSVRLNLTAIEEVGVDGREPRFRTLAMLP